MNETKQSAAEYHADYSRVSNSMLSVFRQSRRRYFQRFVEQSMPAPEPTAAMQLGSLVHTLLLEPDDAAKLVVAPKVDRRTKAGKEEWQAFGLVGLATLLVAALVGMIGKGRMSGANLAPERTIDSLKEDKQWASQQIKSLRN